MWIPAYDSDPTEEEKATAIDEKPAELCNYFPRSPGVFYVTENLSEAERVRGIAIELVLSFFPKIGADCFTDDFPITIEQIL